jgi:type IV pilus assembly protein PilX
MERTMLISNKLLSMHHAARAQCGAVLVVALIFLLLLTILAISASSRSLLQERMAGGLRNSQQADMSAQTALRGAEWKLWTSTSNVSAHLNCGSGIFTDCYIFDPLSPITNVVNFRTKSGWVTVGSTEYKGYANGVNFTTTANGALANNPRYVIEDMGVELPPGVSGSLHESGATGTGGTGSASTSRHIYRVTTRATGASANTVRVLESTFAAKSN